jgi:hypothetical protein
MQDTATDQGRESLVPSAENKVQQSERRDECGDGDSNVLEDEIDEIEGSPPESYRDLKEMQDAKASENIQHAQKRMKRRHANNARYRGKKQATQFVPQIGDYVLLRRGLNHPSDKKKLDSYWIGPYKVSDIIGNIVSLEIPSKSVDEAVVYKTEKYHMDRIRRFVPRVEKDGEESWIFVTVFAREWIKGTCHYLVQWYDGEIGYAEHSEEMMRNEKATGIYPESGIEQGYAQDIADFKRDVLGHQYPILVNNFTNIKEITTRPKTYSTRQLSGKTVVSKVNEQDEHVAGLVWGKADKFLIRFTDGTTEIWEQEKVHQKMIGAPGKKSFDFDVA